MLMMMSLFFDNEVMELPDYSFHIPAFLFALVSFVVMYEVFMRVYSAKIKRIPLKEVMAEE